MSGANDSGKADHGVGDPTVDSMTQAESARMHGVTLPEGQYTIERSWNDAILSATGAPPRGCDDGPHPILASVATLAATGLAIDDLCHLCGASVADGPMLGECRILLRHPLAFDVHYRVKRRILSIERKKGRRLAEMDLLKFVAELVEPGAAIAAEVTYTWVLPRGVRR